MENGFGYSADEILTLGKALVDHLRKGIVDTQGQSYWSGANFESLRAFKYGNLDIEYYPSGVGKDRKAEFLFDLIAYVPGKGILIAAESEWINRHIEEIQHDFEKLLYVRSPIELMLCRIDGDKVTAEETKSQLSRHMQKCCSEFSPGELFIIYCVGWKGSEISRSDVTYQLQIEGEPMHRGLDGEEFTLMVAS
jgi:hypothetical protein